LAANRVSKPQPAKKLIARKHYFTDCSFLASDTELRLFWSVAGSCRCAEWGQTNKEPAMTRLTSALAQEFKIIREASGKPAATRWRSVLPMNQLIHVGDTVVSENGMFYAQLSADGTFRVCRGSSLEHSFGTLWSSKRPGEGFRYFGLVQSDGNFCVYRGDDLQTNEGWQWGTQITGEGGQFFGVLYDDGNFAICAGTGPDDKRAEIWSTGVRDPVCSIDEVVRIDYDLPAARLLQARSSDLYRESVHNHHGDAHTSLITGSVTVSDTSSWGDGLGDVTAPPPFRTVVPLMLGGRVVLSAEQHNFERHNAVTTPKTWGFNAPATIPANSTMLCLVSATRSTICVPFVMTGLFTLASGTQVTGKVSGMYNGCNCHDLAVSLSNVQPEPFAGQVQQAPANASSYH
jgi:hypothetical protein